MRCHICGQEAVDRCYTCGQLFCKDHGEVNCQRCQSAIAPGDRRTDRISARLVRERDEEAWWRPQQAEDYQPPACHVCQGLARKICGNCGQLYCPEHAGPNNLCRECGRSSQLGFIVLIVILGMMGLLILWGLFA